MTQAEPPWWVRLDRVRQRGCPAHPWPRMLGDCSAHTHTHARPDGACPDVFVSMPIERWAPRCTAMHLVAIMRHVLAAHLPDLKHVLRVDAPAYITQYWCAVFSCPEPRVATHPTAPQCREGCRKPSLEHFPPEQRPRGVQARRVILLATHRRSRFEGPDGLLVPLFSISRFITVQAQPVFGCVDGCHPFLLLSGCPGA